jgi:hypothetical protein
MAGAKREMSKKKWGTLIEAARNAGMAKIMGQRSRSEDSVCSNCSTGSHGATSAAGGASGGGSGRSNKFRQILKQQLSTTTDHGWVKRLIIHFFIKLTFRISKNILAFFTV